MKLGWEETEESAVKSAASEPTVEFNILQELYMLEESKSKIDARITEIKEQLSQAVPEEKYIGHLTMGEYTAVAMRDETWKWDTDKLLDIMSVLHPEGLPEYVKRQASISKTKFKELPIEVQNTLLDALEKRPSSVKIIVRKREEMERVADV
jgi:hypothetical protein